MLWSQNNRFYRILLTSCIFSFSLITTPLALAEYQPPSEPSQPDSGDVGTTGRRGGCRTTSAASLTALAPYSHVGQTVSTSPIVAWFVPDSDSFPLEFFLYEYDGDNERKILHQNLQSSPGIMNLSLPNLTVGKQYRWQVVLLCNPNRPSSALITGATIEVMAMPPALKTQLEVTNNPLEEANLYAESGFWYDAFGAVLESTEDLNAKDLGLSLLENLVSLEALSDLESAQEQSVQLQQVVRIEQQSSDE